MVENKKEPDDYSFDFEDTEKIEEIIDKKLVEDKKKHEIDIEYIKNNLPEKKSMETILKKAIVKGKDQNDVLQEKQCVVFETQLDDKNADFMEIIYNDGEPELKKDGRKVIIYDPVFSMDLREHAEGQISDCAATTFPMIADKMVQIALDEKKLRQPEERKAIFNYWWLILLMIMIPVIIVTLMIVRGGGGG